MSKHTAALKKLEIKLVVGDPEKDRHLDGLDGLGAWLAPRIDNPERLLVITDEPEVAAELMMPLRRAYYPHGTDAATGFELIMMHWHQQLMGLIFCLAKPMLPEGVVEILLEEARFVVRTGAAEMVIIADSDVLCHQMARAIGRLYTAAKAEMN